MATNEIQTTISWASTQNVESKPDVFSQIKGFFKRWEQSWNQPKHKTKAFTLTRKDWIVSIAVAFAIVVWACIYWWMVMQKYNEINNKADELKNLSTYNSSLWASTLDLLDPYLEGANATTINGMIQVNNNVQDMLKDRQEFKQQQKSYYEVLLQNIYLPTLNIWKDPYTKDFDIRYLWQKYLEADKFQDLYLIQYWSDFIKHVSDDADYNTIETITIWEMEELEDSNYFYTPISVTFKSPNKRSFLLLVNKLSTTSNTNNIALVNEFFFYLLMNIKEHKQAEISRLMEEYRERFSSSSNREWPSSIDAMTDEQREEYIDKVIWYNLYHWINYSWTWENETDLLDDDLIAETVRENALCEGVKDVECFYKFRDKYRDLPYLAYKVWLEKQTNRTQWLFEFLRDLPSVIAITSFGFEKFSNSSFLNNEQEQYEWTLTFNAYWRTISPEELQEASTVLGELCFESSANQVMSPETALNRINETIGLLWTEWNVNVSALLELQWLFTDIQDEYDNLTNYEKMVKVFELWRMLNDANLCK